MQVCHMHTYRFRIESSDEVILLPHILREAYWLEGPFQSI